MTPVLLRRLRMFGRIAGMLFLFAALLGVWFYFKLRAACPDSMAPRRCPA